MDKNGKVVEGYYNSSRRKDGGSNYDHTMLKEAMVVKWDMNRLLKMKRGSNWENSLDSD